MYKSIRKCNLPNIASKNRGCTNKEDLIVQSDYVRKLKGKSTTSYRYLSAIVETIKVGVCVNTEHMEGFVLKTVRRNYGSKKTNPTPSA